MGERLVYDGFVGRFITENFRNITFDGVHWGRDWNRFNRKSNLENRLKIRLIVSKFRFNDSIFDFD